MFEGKTILITGGTGSLGRALTKKLLEQNAKTVRIFSRNENKQIEMESKFNEEKRLRFFLGDIRDSERLFTALEDVDIVFHAAALKHVPKIEYNPFESIKTNVIGSQNVIDNCLKQNVQKVIAIGTDKAVSPLNTYGATKLLMEKLFVSANNYLNREKYRTRFHAVRYGNVLGSSGSVIPKFIQQIKNNEKIRITDSAMTRFNITMGNALDLIINTAKIGKGSEIFIPKLKAYNIMDVKSALFDLLHETEYEVVGIRPGEKLHETLINEDEMRYTWKINDMLMITNPHYELFNDKNIEANYENLEKENNLTSYSSDKVEKLTIDELKIIIKNSGLLS
jgi:UDP-N-acetylglucosamine 4,6-dehydratase/UDP-glucose 4-epimerase